MNFSSASLFPARKWEADTQGGTRRIYHPTRKRTQGADIVKGWAAKQNQERIPDTFTYNKNDMIADTLGLPLSK